MLFHRSANSLSPVWLFITLTTKCGLGCKGRALQLFSLSRRLSRTPPPSHLLMMGNRSWSTTRPTSANRVANRPPVCAAKSRASAYLTAQVILCWTMSTGRGSVRARATVMENVKSTTRSPIIIARGANVGACRYPTPTEITRRNPTGGRRRARSSPYVRLQIGIRPLCHPWGGRNSRTNGIPLRMALERCLTNRNSTSCYMPTVATFCSGSAMRPCRRIGTKISLVGCHHRVRHQARRLGRPHHHPLQSLFRCRPLRGCALLLSSGTRW